MCNTIPTVRIYNMNTDHVMGGMFSVQPGLAAWLQNKPNGGQEPSRYIYATRETCSSNAIRINADENVQGSQGMREKRELHTEIK